MIYTKISSKWGKLISAIETDGSITGLWFENQKYFPKIPLTALWLDENINSNSENFVEAYETITQLKAELKSYELGTLKNFSLKLSPNGTSFQKHVWSMLIDIPYGTTLTYKEIGQLIAKKLERQTMSSQAIGGAVGHNPISIFIPCHRIIGTNGKLTGYAGGLDKKRALLIHEGLKIDI